MRKLTGVTLHYDDGTHLFIDNSVISLMQEATESIELLNKAKDTAKRIVELSE